MTTIQLWHKKNPTFLCTIEQPNYDEYTLVATFDFDRAQSSANNCKHVWNKSQNQENQWRIDTRSTCVGDIMRIVSSDSDDCDTLCVADFGMKLIPKVMLDL
jgi:hypothetical protein